MLCGYPVSLTVSSIPPLPSECLQSWPGMAPRNWLDPSGFCRTCEGYKEPGNGESGMKSLLGFLPNAYFPYLPHRDGVPCGDRAILIYLYSFQIKYKKDALNNYPNFTSVVDPPEIVLAKINSINQSDVSSCCTCWSAWTEKLSVIGCLTSR